MAMYMATNQVFKTFATELSTVPALAEGIQAFDHLVEQIDETHRIQMSYMPVNSKLKTKEEAEMIQAAVQVAAALFVYGLDSQQPDLQARVSVTPSALKGMTDKALKNACLNIYQLAQTHVSELAVYGVTPETLTNLKKEIDDFAALIVAPRSEVVTRSQATARLRELFDMADELLKSKLDKLMVQLEMSHPNVYKTYQSARIIVDMKNSKAIEEELMAAEA